MNSMHVQVGSSNTEQCSVFTLGCYWMESPAVYLERALRCATGVLVRVGLQLRFQGLANTHICTMGKS